jgi:hypothetical protein
MNSIARLTMILLMAIPQVRAIELPSGVSTLSCKSTAGLIFKFIEGTQYTFNVTYAGMTKDFNLAHSPRFFHEDLTSTYPFKIVRKKNFTSIELYSTGNTLYDREFYYLEFDGNLLQSKQLQNISGVARKSIIPYGIGRAPIDSPEVAIRCSLKFSFDN